MGLRISEAKAKQLGIPLDAPSSIRPPLPSGHVPGRIQIFEFPGHPARLNELLGHRMKAARRKKHDRITIALWSALSGVAAAAGPRSVAIRIVLAKGQRAGDPDAYWKSTLDGCVACRLLLDDNRQNCTLGPVIFTRGPRKFTVIELTDL